MKKLEMICDGRTPMTKDMQCVFLIAMLKRNEDTAAGASEVLEAGPKGYKAVLRALRAEDNDEKMVGALAACIEMCWMTEDQVRNFAKTDKL